MRPLGKMGSFRMCPQTCGSCWGKASEDTEEDYEFEMANVIGRNNGRNLRALTNSSLLFIWILPFLNLF